MSLCVYTYCYGSGNSNRRSRVISRTSVPSTVSETDEKYSMATPSANILLSVYDDDKSNQTLLPSDNGAQSQVISRSTSPIPSQNNPRYRSSSGSNGKQQQYGQFLNPNDRVEHENGYTSDHSDHSYRSATSKNTRRKSSGHHTNGHKQKEKKNSDVVDMQLLEDVPAWLRSLRLHKYNPIFEKMKWQDMLKLSDEELLAKGVAALGARRKLLKVFDQVKAHCEANNIKY
ncbi:Putative Protein VTS1 [Rhizopus microsporus]|nr:Putative Protein VTS1 [Rhizopus microsporus]